MDNLENTVTVEEKIDVQPETEFTQNEEIVTEENVEIEDTSVSSDYVKKEDEEEEEKPEDEMADEETSETDETEDEEEEKKRNTRNYELLEEELNTLKESYSALQTQYQELMNFKNEIDNQKKDALIAEFYMLSDEDKADVLANKEKYTIDEIKAKLSVICFDKKINFTLNEVEDKKEKEEDIVTYTMNNNEDSGLPEWVKAVKEQEKLG